MNHHQKQVIDNTALAPLSHRWLNNELETTLEGKTGYGKLQFGEPRWAHAASKPFGTPFKPKRPEVTGHGFQTPFVKVQNLNEIKPVIPKPVKAEPQVIICVAETPNNLAESQLRRARTAMEIQARAIDFYASKVVSRAVEPKPKRIHKPKANRYAPGVCGLDKARTGKPDPMPDWEREKLERGELIQYYLLLKSLYGLIYSR